MRRGKALPGKVELTGPLAAVQMPKVADDKLLPKIGDGYYTLQLRPSRTLQAVTVQVESDRDLCSSALLILSPSMCRELAAQLLAGADYAEGK